MSDAGIAHIAAFCTNGLQSLGLNLLHKLSLEGLLPLLEDPERAARLEVLSLSALRNHIYDMREED